MGQRKNAKGGANGVFKGSQLKNTQKVGKLRKNWHAVETHGTAYADLILAVRSAYFIGNPASSFSANVVMIRRALGAAPESSNLRVLDFPRPGSYK